MLAGRHQELLRAAKKEHLASLSDAQKDTPLHTKAICSLGDMLIQVGVWLQVQAGRLADSRGLKIDERLWESKPKVPAC
jgi:hypothetical protein